MRARDQFPPTPHADLLSLIRHEYVAEFPMPELDAWPPHEEAAPPTVPKQASEPA